MKRFTLQEFLNVVDMTSEVCHISTQFPRYPLQERKSYATFKDLQHRASIAELEAEVERVWIGEGDDGVDIDLKARKDYSTKRP